MARTAALIGKSAKTRRKRVSKRCVSQKHLSGDESSISHFANALRSDVTGKPIEFLSLVISTFGLVIAVGAALFAFDQIIGVKQALDSQAYADITQSLADLNRLFVEHPDARPYFFANEPLRNNATQRQEILAVADSYLNFIDDYYAQSSHLDAPHLRAQGVASVF